MVRWMKGLDVSRVGVVLGTGWQDGLTKRQVWAVKKGGRAARRPEVRTGTGTTLSTRLYLPPNRRAVALWALSLLHSL